MSQSREKERRKERKRQATLHDLLNVLKTSYNALYQQSGCTAVSRVLMWNVEVE
jgi:hypothetical protein